MILFHKHNSICHFHMDGKHCSNVCVVDICPLNIPKNNILVKTGVKEIISRVQPKNEESGFQPIAYAG